MEDALMSLSDDPAILKQIIVTRTHEHDDWKVKFKNIEVEKQRIEIEKLRLEVELLRLKKCYYGPRADQLSTPGDVAQLLLNFATELDTRPVNPDDLPPDEPLPPVGTVRRFRRGRRNLAA